MPSELASFWNYSRQSETVAGGVTEMGVRGEGSSVWRQPWREVKQQRERGDKRNLEAG